MLFSKGEIGFVNLTAVIVEATFVCCNPRSSTAKHRVENLVTFVGKSM